MGFDLDCCGNRLVEIMGSRRCWNALPSMKLDVGFSLTDLFALCMFIINCCHFTLDSFINDVQKIGKLYEQIFPIMHRHFMLIF